MDERPDPRESTEPWIVEHGKLRFMGVLGTFIADGPDANKLDAIAPLWERFHATQRVAARVSALHNYGLVFPQTPAKRAHPHEMEYLAGVRVKDFQGTPRGLTTRTLKPATYAVFERRGPMRELVTRIRCIARRWALEAGYSHTGGPDIEAHGARFSATGAASTMQYWIPIEPSAAAPEPSKAAAPPSTPMDAGGPAT